MTRALVVHHDIDLADQEVESLRRFGYTVEQCSGPTANTCPVLNGGECVMAARADVLVYDAWAGGDSDGGRRLVEHLREVYADLPVVLTAVDGRVNWVETEGANRVTPLSGRPSLESFRQAIESALADQGMAV